jgi:hypothetical protein
MLGKRQFMSDEENKNKNPPIPPKLISLKRNRNPEINWDDDNDDEIGLIVKLITDENNLRREKEVKKSIITVNNCRNKLCNHKTFEEDPEPFPKNPIPITKIKNIYDLIEIGKTYHCKKNTSFHGIDLKILCNLVEPLTELSEMIGMKKVKEQMVNQILFFLQDFNKKASSTKEEGDGESNKDDMMHTVITGPPGVGKTQLGKILGKVYKEMGILKKGHFKLVTRADLVAKYLGQTAPKTQEVIDSCRDGVMFIDEAYALGSPEGRDSFSKECLDTLNQNLSERRDFLCIIAGYKDSLDKNFFAMNEGLKRRFTFRYEIEEYNSNELRDIFCLKVRLDKWSLECTIKEDDDEKTRDKKRDEFKKITQFFEKNKSNFPNFGGDVETLYFNCKIAHSRRVFFIGPEARRILTLEDINEGLNVFIDNRKPQENNKTKIGFKLFS